MRHFFGFFTHCELEENKKKNAKFKIFTTLRVGRYAFLFRNTL